MDSTSFSLPPLAASAEEVPSEGDDESGVDLNVKPPALARNTQGPTAVHTGETLMTLFDLCSAAASGSEYDSFDSLDMILRTADY